MRFRQKHHPMVGHGALWSRSEPMKKNIENDGAPSLAIALARC
jgi:hypothetical protein